MIITRHNYEEFFLLYLDNELPAAQRQMVEDFIQNNPDLEKEWLAFQQSRLRPDKALVFPAKESLLQIATADQFVHFTNYTECFLLYADNELSEAQKKAVEQFVYNHPQFQQEFELIHEARMIPDNGTVFPDKERLYRSEKATRPVMLYWWKPAVAAAVLIIAGLFWLNRSPDSEAVVKVVNLPSVMPQPKDIRTQKAVKGVKDQPADPGVTAGRQPLKGTFTRGSSKEERLVSTTSLKNPENRPGTTNTGDETTHLPIGPLATTTDPASTQVGNTMPTGTETAAMDPSARLDAISSQHDKLVIDEVERPAESGVEARQALVSAEEKSDNVVFTNIPVNNKPGLRRFFRKASRYIDKTTALRSGERSGILIGNFKIAFQ